jgi:succinoglycan biosynthesis protein ExoO
VVDDGSTDATAAALEPALADPRVRLLRHAANRGAAAARNSALAAARGAWLAPIDADDVLEPFRLERLFAEAEAAQADLIADNLRLDDGDSEAPGEYAWDPAFLARSSPLTVAALVRSDLPRNGICSFGYLKPLMRRAFLERHGLRYDETLSMTEDFQLFTRAVLAGARFCCAGWAGYRYRRGPGSLSRAPERFEANLRAAAEGSRRLAERATALGQVDAARQLRAHRIAIEQTLAMDGARRALRARRWRDAWRELRTLPAHPWVLLRGLAARLRAGRRHTPMALATGSVRSRSRRSREDVPA